MYFGMQKIIHKTALQTMAKDQEKEANKKAEKDELGCCY